MEDTQPETQAKQITSLRVMYDPAAMSPALAVDGEVYTVDPDTAEGIAKALHTAVAMSNRARGAELN